MSVGLLLLNLDLTAPSNSLARESLKCCCYSVPHNTYSLSPYHLCINLDRTVYSDKARLLFATIITPLNSSRKISHLFQRKFWLQSMRSTTRGPPKPLLIIIAQYIFSFLFTCKTFSICISISIHFLRNILNNAMEHNEVFNTPVVVFSS